MGMYTGLRFKGIIKDEYRKDIDKLINYDFYWEDLNNQIFKDFSKVSRSNFIPFGMLSYMPDSWEINTWERDGDGDYIRIVKDGFDRRFNYNNGLLTFQCSLNNYDNTIQYFLNHIVPQISQTLYHLEVFYEENSISNLYKLDNNKLIKLDKGIRYYDRDCNYNIFTGEPYYENDNFYKYEKFDFSYGGVC